MPSQRPSNNGCGNLFGGGGGVFPPPATPQPTQSNRAAEMDSIMTLPGGASERAPRCVIMARDVSTTGAPRVPSPTGPRHTGPSGVPGLTRLPVGWQRPARRIRFAHRGESMATPDQDKRKGKPRIPRRLPVRFGSEAKMCGGTATDISEGGMKVECTESFATHSVITVFVQFPRHSVRLRARVVWCGAASQGGSAVMGLAL